MPKRTTTPDRVPPTDEWGIYDPAKAGMPALYARLGRPVIRASSKKLRQERRRGYRPERTNDGVGLAIEEAMRRAGVMEAKGEVDAPIAQMSPARAVRMAMKAALPPNVATTATVETPLAPVVAAPPAPVVEAAPKRKPARRAKAAEAVAALVTAAAVAQVSTASVTAPVTEQAETAPVEATPNQAAIAAESALTTRAPRNTAKARMKREPARVAAAPAPSAPHGPPAPSPRRPRGQVPLAAWAHAVVDAPKTQPRRADKRGFWRDIFRMPAEVALVEYAHGCRIHRLMIETSDEAAMPDLL